jgi:hypothetical protein
VLKNMKTTFSQQQRREKGLWAAASVLCLGLASAPAQLAITEVMSFAAVTHHRTNSVPGQSDWWKLTNFGTNWIDLTGYFWTDSSRSPDPSAWRAFQGLVIGPGESVIFFRAKETLTEEKFREWWGACLGSAVRVRSWDRRGFDDKYGDEIWLYDSQTNLVDQVSFGAARQGVTFTYDTNTGVFGAYSVLGQCGTCQAATADDIGSPGTNCGPVPLRILEQPVSIVQDAGMDVTFAVLAVGLPRPKYQWFFNGAPILGETSSRLTIPETQPMHAGEYQVVVSNGLDRLLSTQATLTVATNPHAPDLCAALEDVERFEGEPAVFDVCVRAYPQSRFQWQSNGVDIAGATNRVLSLPDVNLAASGTTYRVRIWNVYGSTNASARLLVEPWPTLAITEAFPAPSLNPAPVLRWNWWELTNLGINAVNIKGFQHSDRPSVLGARRVTVNAVLLPGESVIFVDTGTREEFLRWWGETNLPPRLQVITYGGYGLSAWSDEIHLWSAAGSQLAYVLYASPTPYPILPPAIPCGSDCGTSLCDHPIYGHSLFFDTNDCAFFGQGSEEEVNGAFRAAVSDDVGSPGFCVLPRIFGFSFHGSSVVLQCRVLKGRSYQFEWRLDLAVGDWVTDGVIHAAQGSTLTVTHMPSPSAPQCFYRLREVP